MKKSRTKYSKNFQQFWRLWPGRWNQDTGIVKVGKKEAYREWKQLDEELQEFIIEKILKTGRLKSKGTQYLPDACRWLKKERWDDFE